MANQIAGSDVAASTSDILSARLILYIASVVVASTSETPQHVCETMSLPKSSFNARGSVRDASYSAQIPTQLILEAISSSVMITLERVVKSYLDNPGALILDSTRPGCALEVVRLCFNVFQGGKIVF